ncbi:hypothetical protein G6677_09195 [Polynucleobacter paneuropaeus]|nr:hypothetical protein [Polynucleobacter paneuropaeus]
MQNTKTEAQKLKIQNFKARYLPGQDRLLFEVVCTKELSYRFWVTRRVAQRFLSDVDLVLNETMGKLHSQEVTKALKEFELQRAKGGLKKTPPTPLDPNDLQKNGPPRLILDAKVTEKSGKFAVEFVLLDNQVFSLTLSQLQIAKVYSIFLDRQDVAKWDLQNIKHLTEQKDVDGLNLKIEANPKKVMH